MACVYDHGVNGVKVFRSREETYIYYTSTDTALLARVPVDPVTAFAIGPVEVVARDLDAVDDFALLSDGSAIIATGANAVIMHVGLNGNVTIVAELAYSTSCQFGRSGELYVATGGSAAAASVFAVDLYPSPVKQ